MIDINTKKRIQTSFILLFLIYIMIKFNFFATYILLIIAVLSIIEFLQITKKIFRNFFFHYCSNIIFIIYLIIFCYFFIFFINFFHLKIVIYSLILGCVASDVGGFIFGKILRGPKLTKVSPNKTYSGSFGSIILTCFVFSISLFLFTNSFSYLILIVSLITSISCQLGDLFFSFLKRKAKVKDTGTLLPGHGGILDRIDGMLLGIPLGFVSLTILT